MAPEMLRLSSCDAAGIRHSPTPHLALQATTLVCSMSLKWTASCSWQKLLNLGGSGGAGALGALGVGGGHQAG